MEQHNYCGIIIVRQGTMFVAFVGNSPPPLLPMSLHPHEPIPNQFVSYLSKYDYTTNENTFPLIKKILATHEY